MLKPNYSYYSQQLWTHSWRGTIISEQSQIKYFLAHTRPSPPTCECRQNRLPSVKFRMKIERLIPQMLLYSCHSMFLTWIFIVKRGAHEMWHHISCQNIDPKYCGVRRTSTRYVDMRADAPPSPHQWASQLSLLSFAKHEKIVYVQ